MTMQKDFLVEIGTEDLPARFVTTLANEFGDNLCKELSAAELIFKTHRVFSTPRRLAVLVESLATQQQDRIIERKGPAVISAFDAYGKPTKAAIGFAQSCGVEVNQLETETDSKKPKLVFRERRSGIETTALIADMVNNAVNKLSIPRRMRWNELDYAFIRPIRWLLVIFGTSIVDVNISGIKSNNVSYGHRFHNAKPIVVKNPFAYKDLLQTKGYVLVDFAERQANILQQVNKIAKKVKATPAYSQELLDEITNLIEWPVALLGEFDKKFLQVQQEVLISTMQDNQKYIPLLSNKGELLSKFIIISNIESKNPDIVKHGNERVIVPRFEDAMFFWQRDQNQTLEARCERLKNVVFEKQLGSLHDKTLRISELAAWLSTYINADKKLTKRAAMLSKCDLLTDMVGEFPKLQGVVGNALARHDGEPKEVCIALEEQYLPRYAKDNLPKTFVGQALALADRLDTLLGNFAIGKKPTGLKDPYGLRRAALAVLRILIESPIDLDLLQCLQKAASLFDTKLKASTVIDEVFAYMLERLRSYFSDQGIAPDVIESVLANQPNSPCDIAARIEALTNFRKLPNAQSLAAANKRIRNILKKADRTSIGKVNKKLLKEDAENSLHSSLESLSTDVEKFFKHHEYERALNKLADLRQPVDRFFDDVMVMDEDEALKTNRIALLAKIDALFMQVADFSRLQS